jgi:beta-barrel assembly-enhancing protease
MIKHKNPAWLIGLVLTVFLVGCVSLGEMVENDPIGLAQSVVKVGQATLTASQEITEEQEMYLGRTVSARLLKQYRLYRNPTTHQYVNMVGTTIGMVSDRPDLSYHFAVLDTDEVNAFAAPGGYIFITRGILTRLNGEDELAAILAHEIGHACAKHSLKSIKGELWKKVLTVTAEETARHQGVDPQLVDMFGQAADEVVGTLVTVGYSQPMEYEADRLGQTYAAKAGYDPMSLKRYIEVMTVREKQKDRGLEARLGTHPSFQSRLEKLPRATGKEPSPDALKFRQARYRKQAI